MLSRTLQGCEAFPVFMELLMAALAAPSYAQISEYVFLSHFDVKWVQLAEHSWLTKFFIY